MLFNFSVTMDFEKVEFCLSKLNDQFITFLFTSPEYEDCLEDISRALSVCLRVFANDSVKFSKICSFIKDKLQKLFPKPNFAIVMWILLSGTKTEQILQALREIIGDPKPIVTELIESFESYQYSELETPQGSVNSLWQNIFACLYKFPLPGDFKEFQQVLKTYNLMDSSQSKQSVLYLIENNYVHFHITLMNISWLVECEQNLKANKKSTIHPFFAFKSTNPELNYIVKQLAAFSSSSIVPKKFQINNQEEGARESNPNNEQFELSECRDWFRFFTFCYVFDLPELLVVNDKANPIICLRRWKRIVKWIGGVSKSSKDTFFLKYLDKWREDLIGNRKELDSLYDDTSNLPLSLKVSETPKSMYGCDFSEMNGGGYSKISKTPQLRKLMNFFHLIKNFKETSNNIPIVSPAEVNFFCF